LIDSVIQSVSAALFETPLYNPFVTSQGCAHVARAVVVEIRLADGTVCRGESVPVQYVTGETIESVLDICTQVAPLLVGTDVRQFRQPLTVLAPLVSTSPSARCGLEMAILKGFSHATGTTLHQLCGAALGSMHTDITIPIVPNAGELTELAWATGMRVFKIKVGDPDRSADLARVSAIRAAAPQARIRIDANQAFTPQEALDFVTNLVEDGAQIDLLEQPVPSRDFEGLAWVAERSPVPVFADESCITPANALKLVNTAVHGLNLKINKNGIFGVLDIIAIAKAANRKLMLGCMLETRYSIAQSLAIACGTGAFDFLDLDSHLLLNEPANDSLFSQIGPELILP